MDFLAQVQEDETLRAILVDADLIVCDGTPLVWMSKWLGNPLPERIAGSDLVPLLLDLAQEHGHRVFFLGGRDEVVAIAEDKIKERWPRLQIAGMYFATFRRWTEWITPESADASVRQTRICCSFPSVSETGKMARHEFQGSRSAGGHRCGGHHRFPRRCRETRPGLDAPHRAGMALPCLSGTQTARPPLLDGHLCGGPRPAQTTDENGSAPTRFPESARPAVCCRKTGFSESRSALPTVVVLPERLDALSARDASLWPAGLHPNLILDARLTGFIDSTGTGKLVRFARTSREHGGICVLMGASQVFSARSIS